MSKVDPNKSKQQLISELVTLRRQIAEWEASEVEDKEIRDQLGRSEMRAAFEQFARDIGHELRNPLGAIKNAAYFLDMALEKPETEVKEALNILEKNVKKSEKIISSLLVFTHTRFPNLLKVSIDDIVGNARSRTSVQKKMERDRDPRIPFITEERSTEQRASILIIDDDTITCRSLGLILGKRGYEIETAGTGREAIAKAEGRFFNLALLDIKLPDMEGVELIAPLKEMHSDMAVIMITGYASLETAIQALNNGASAYITKPLNMDEVLATVREALEKQHLVMENKKLYQAAQQELAERKKAEEALRHERDFMARIMETSPVCIIMVNQEGQITFANPGAEEVLGLSPDEVTRRTYNSPEWRITDYDGKPFPDEQLPFRQVMKTGGPAYDVRHAIEWPDGRRVLLSINGAPLFDNGDQIEGVIFTIQDVTGQVKTSKALQASEEHYRTLFEQSRDPIYLNTQEGIFLDVNQAYLDLFGYTREEMKDLNVEHVYLNPGDRKKLQQEVEQKGFVSDFGVKLRKKDTTIMDCLLTATLRKSGDGNILGYQGIVRDITEQRKLESQLRQAQKMEAIGTLAGGIAHDFNNILSLIMGYTELTMMSLHEKGLARDNMNKLLKAGERARDLVKQILAFGRYAEQEQNPVQIHLIIKESLKLLRSTLPATIEICQNIASTSMVLADPTQMNQVIINLCTNAYHAMQEKGGVLEVSLSDVELESDFTARHLDTHIGPYIRFTVSDTGHGMDKEVLGRIFDPYYTTREKTGGTGMGLAVVHGIVKSHGGVITVYSEPGKGTTFNVFLPRIESAEGVVEPEEIVPLPIGKERILFVDDEPAIVDIGKGMLENLGYTVATRTSPIEALEAFKAQPGKFDLVITDMTMPKMTGDELAKELMRIRPDLPILLCTGFSELINERKSKAMGIRAFVMKPVVQREMAEAVREALDT